MFQDVLIAGEITTEHYLTSLYWYVKLLNVVHFKSVSLLRNGICFV